MFQTEFAAATTFTPVFLNQADIKLAVHFIEAVRATQPDQFKHHLKPKQDDDFHAALDNGGMLMGIQGYDGQLVAFALANPSDHGVCKLESVCVNATQRGLGLGSKLLSLATDWAQANQFTTLRAKVATDNDKSQCLFTQNGFHVIKSAYDTEGGYAYSLLDRQL